jgi:PGF-pre-PGF domain-containing protein
MRNSLKASVFTLVIFLFSLQSTAAFSYTNYLEPTGGAIGFEIAQDDVSLERVSFNLSEQKERFTVRVDTINPDVQWVYDYFVVSATGMQAEPESILFGIRVSKSWIDENDINTGTIALSIYEEEWTRLETTEISEDSEFIHYSANPPNLTAYFAVTGEPMSVNIVVTRPCNNNGVCELSRGEDVENCNDCIRRITGSKCVPSERYCLDDYLFECSEDGSEYALNECRGGCSQGECIMLGAPTGMAVAMNPVFIFLVVALLSIITYLTVLVKRTKRKLQKAEELKHTHAGFKAMAKRKR